MDDLSAFDTLSAAEEGRKMHIMKPGKSEFFTTDGKPWSVTLHGEDSEVFRRFKHDMWRLVAERNARGEKVEGRGIDLLLADVAAKCTISWSGVAIGGEEIPFSKEKAAEIYKAYPWLLDQVMRFIETRENFI